MKRFLAQPNGAFDKSQVFLDGWALRVVSNTVVSDKTIATIQATSEEGQKRSFAVSVLRPLDRWDLILALKEKLMGGGGGNF